ncbi:MAG TPA: anhydro-N-acetylmuramic acid kinase [Gammaproteobacteria bacterium]|nr:anhydro-N-acetylmuramic acid kinase [Gammaproteobacteria bacterium]
MSSRYIGLMSGTSLDGIDVVLAELSHTPPRIETTLHNPYDPDLRRQLLELSGQEQVSVESLLTLDVRLGQAFAQAIRALLSHAGIPPAEVEAIGSHGQTIRHLPEAPVRNTLQIGDPNIIAQETGITTVADFRRRDLAAGGQGAPLVPAFHGAVFTSPEEYRVIVNIGGIANLTLLPPAGDGGITGFDCGPGNLLMDSWAARHLGAPMDRDGRWAASGTVHRPLLNRLMADAYFRRPPPKSSGREHFSPAWLETAMASLKAQPSAADVQATLCELTAATIAGAIREHAPGAARVLVCGGGVHNTHLMERLGHHLEDLPICSTADHGMDPDWVEATAFAWLARQTLEGRPGNLPAVTGAEREVILGGIYLGQ